MVITRSGQVQRSPRLHNCFTQLLSGTGHLNSSGTGPKTWPPHGPRFVIWKYPKNAGSCPGAPTHSPPPPHTAPKTGPPHGPRFVIWKYPKNAGSCPGGRTPSEPPSKTTRRPDLVNGFLL